MMQEAVLRKTRAILVDDKAQNRVISIALCREVTRGPRRQGRAQQAVAELPDGTRLTSSISRMVQCYGWLKLRDALLRGLSWNLRAPWSKVDRVERFISSSGDEAQTALVY